MEVSIEMDEIDEKTFAHYMRNAKRALDDATINMTVAQGTPWDERTRVLEKLMNDVFDIYDALEKLEKEAEGNADEQ